RTRAGEGDTRTIARESIVALGPDAWQDRALFVHRDGDGRVALRDSALDLFRADSGQPRGAIRRVVSLHLRTPEPRPAHFDEGANADGSVSARPGVFTAGRLFLRLHFSTRNDALDFLRHRRVSARDLFHRADAGDHFARRNSCRILVLDRGAGGDGRRLVFALRAPLPQEDRIIGKKFSYAAEVKVIGSRRCVARPAVISSFELRHSFVLRHSDFIIFPMRSQSLSSLSI